jgi:hypothetical protein
MTREQPRPLHRLTPLRDDPLAAWLSPGQHLRVTLTGWGGWLIFGLLMKLVWWVLFILCAHVFYVPDGRLPSVLAGMATLALIWPMRRVVMRMRSRKMAELVRRSAPAEAAPVDDFTQLEHEPDGRLVSLVGWARARGSSMMSVAGAGDAGALKVAGEECIGLTIACHQRYPGVMETSNDFDLVDEAGNSVLVQMADARMLGAPNANLTDANARRMLIASLDLPVGAVATGWDAYGLRDGDPLMIVGFKQQAMDPTQHSLRGAPTRVAVGSAPPRPLLLYPIPAERKPAPKLGFSL